MAHCRVSELHPFELHIRGLDYYKDRGPIVAIAMGIFFFIALAGGLYSGISERNEYNKTQAERRAAARADENRRRLEESETDSQRDIRLAVEREIVKTRASARYPPNEPPTAPRLQAQDTSRLSLEMSDIDLNDTGSSTTPNVPPKAIIRHGSLAAVPPSRESWPLRNLTGPFKDAGSKRITPQDRLKVKLNGGSRN
ncbi:hypothetical protein EDB81DRAFT_762098 [Dactylonectria macrodidyma]|uniref:Uncharacterized protein n=1 Tax=Dactylonectria macrodidyma TaxID=307937 RepID=A0A9P9IZA7_9HYPO|nr:hypothetical protein EDB81DRAFT_762098 [Dactylonectria macrodidyma]